MTTTVPRGIQTLVRKDPATKAKLFKYRVQVDKAGFKTDKLFDDLDDATLFLEDTKTPAGRLAIAEGRDRAQFAQKALKAHIEDVMGSGRLTVGQAIDLQITKEYEPIIEARKSDKLVRTAKVNRSRLNAARRIKIGHVKQGFLEPSGVYAGLRSKAKGYVEKALQDFHIDELTAQQVSDYLRKRLDDGVGKPTLKREIGALQSVVNKLEYYDNAAWRRLKGVNPFKSYDKKLVKGGIRRRRNIITTDIEQRLYEAMLKTRNKTYPLVLAIALATSMRRAEILDLHWSQIHLDRGYIDLDPDQTKAEKERLVMLLPDAVKVFEAIPKNGDKLFKLTIEGFKTGFARILKRADLKDVHFHDSRRSAISMLMASVTGSSAAIADIIGAQNVRNLEETTLRPLRQTELAMSRRRMTQEDVLAMVGHADAQTSLGYMNVKELINPKKD